MCLQKAPHVPRLPHVRVLTHSLAVAQKLALLHLAIPLNLRLKVRIEKAFFLLLVLDPFVSSFLFLELLLHQLNRAPHFGFVNK
jgi:hypothetical protein